jgi:hypothetical protein
MVQSTDRQQAPQKNFHLRGLESQRSSKAIGGIAHLLSGCVATLAARALPGDGRMMISFRPPLSWQT